MWLCYGVHGPSVGTNDLGMLNEANSAVHFARFGDFKVLGDAIFHNTNNAVRIPNGAEASEREYHEVKSAQGVRGEIEHYFTFKNRFGLFQSPSKLNTKAYMHLINCIFLQNISICIHGSQVSKVFNMATPFWEDYIREQRHYNEV